MEWGLRPWEINGQCSEEMLVHLFRAREERIQSMRPVEDGEAAPRPMRRLSNEQFLRKHGFTIQKVPVKVN